MGCVRFRKTHFAHRCGDKTQERLEDVSVTYLQPKSDWPSLTSDTCISAPNPPVSTMECVARGCVAKDKTPDEAYFVMLPAIATGA